MFKDRRGNTFLILFDNSHLAEPINTFHGIQENNDEPIRVSYHKNIHYNSVVNPYKASVGVGLGLPSFKPGVGVVNKTHTFEYLFIEDFLC